MITEFQLVVKASTEQNCSDQMDDFTSKFLEIAGDGPWECIDETLGPDPAWVPGLGFKGQNRGFKAYRKFMNRRNGSDGE